MGEQIEQKSSNHVVLEPPERESERDVGKDVGAGTGGAHTQPPTHFAGGEAKAWATSRDGYSDDVINEYDNEMISPKLQFVLVGILCNYCFIVLLSTIQTFQRIL